MNYDKKGGFAPYTGFGNELSIDEIYSEITNIMKGKQMVTWEDITSVISDIENLIPADTQILDDKLRKNGYFFSDPLCEKPKFIFKVEN